MNLNSGMGGSYEHDQGSLCFNYFEAFDRSDEDQEVIKNLEKVFENFAGDYLFSDEEAYDRFEQEEESDNEEEEESDESDNDEEESENEEEESDESDDGEDSDNEESDESDDGDDSDNGGGGGGESDFFRRKGPIVYRVIPEDEDDEYYEYIVIRVTR